MIERRTYIYSGLAVILVLSPLFLNSYWVDVLNNVGLYAILGLSLDLIVGHAGLFNLGHAAFYAVGAYTAAVLNTRFGIPILWLLPASALAAGLFAAIVSKPIIHLRGDYFCIVTIGLGEIVRIALTNDVFGLTGGPNGVFGISRPTVFGMVIRRPQQFFYLIWGFLALTAFLFQRLRYSRFGRALNYLREDEVAAEGSGINVAHYKLACVVIGAAWAGMAGDIYAAKMTIISPESFTFWESCIMFTLLLLGGSANIPGVILGAFLVVFLPEVFRDFANARMMIFGAAMMAMMIFRTQGILPARPRTYVIPKGLPSEEAP